MGPALTAALGATVAEVAASRPGCDRPEPALTATPATAMTAAVPPATPAAALRRRRRPARTSSFTESRCAGGWVDDKDSSRSRTGLSVMTFSLRS